VILTKHAHAAVTLTKAGKSIVIDPGTYTPNAIELLTAATAAFFTHDHFDHFDQQAVRAALGFNPALRVFGPPSVAAQLDGVDGLVLAVQAGSRVQVGGFSVSVHGQQHALIHPLLPRGENVAYLVEESLLHPGDAYVVPPVPIDTLLVPTSGPWTKTGDAIDYVRAVGPARSIQIHEGSLNARGIASVARLLGADGATGIPLLTLSDGESVEI
jgi:L-ascorbate metabolism protein UlaG (beta-lactamase superfamily)